MNNVVELENPFYRIFENDLIFFMRLEYRLVSPEWKTTRANPTKSIKFDLMQYLIRLFSALSYFHMNFKRSCIVSHHI